MGDTIAIDNFPTLEDLVMSFRDLDLVAPPSPPHVTLTFPEDWTCITALDVAQRLAGAPLFTPNRSPETEVALESRCRRIVPYIHLGIRRDRLPTFSALLPTGKNHRQSFTDRRKVKTLEYLYGERLQVAHLDAVRASKPMWGYVTRLTAAISLDSQLSACVNAVRQPLDANYFTPKSTQDFKPTHVIKPCASGPTPKSTQDFHFTPKSTQDFVTPKSTQDFVTPKSTQDFITPKSTQDFEPTHGIKLCTSRPAPTWKRLEGGFERLETERRFMADVDFEDHTTAAMLSPSGGTKRKLRSSSSAPDLAGKPGKAGESGGPFKSPQYFESGQPGESFELDQYFEFEQSFESGEFSKSGKSYDSDKSGEPDQPFDSDAQSSAKRARLI
jgi:hypothetical protein